MPQNDLPPCIIELLSSVCFDLFVFFIGLILIIILSYFAFKTKEKEKYFIALLATIVFGMYALINYDPKKTKIECPPPMVPMRSAPEQQTNISTNTQP